MRKASFMPKKGEEVDYFYSGKRYKGRYIGKRDCSSGLYYIKPTHIYDQPLPKQERDIILIHSSLVFTANEFKPIWWVGW